MVDDPVEPTYVQLCGTFAVETAGRRIDHLLPGRQGRVLFAYLTLRRTQPISRDVLVEALWGDAPPANAPAALSALISKIRTAVGAHVLRGRHMVSLTLTEPARVDVEAALIGLHAAESAMATADWKTSWASSRSAIFIGRRGFLPEAEAPWAEAWRRRMVDVRVRGLECYVQSCLELGGTELPGAERGGRELVELAPLHETGHLLLMRALAARGNPAEALAAYERLRLLLSDELGVSPSAAVQEVYRRLLEH